MVITIEVAGAPVSKNQGMRIDPRRPGMPMFRPQEATDWMRRIRQEAQLVARAAKWPDPFLVSEVAIDFHKFNSRHDSGAGNEYVFDALQVPTIRDMTRFKSSWGLYSNDRDAWCRESPMPVRDDGARRCVFVAELLRTRTPEEADRLRGLWLASIRRAHEKSHTPPTKGS
jgi:hypothetical protein